MAKSAKPRKRTPSTQAKSKPNKLNAAVRGSFSLNILRLAEYSTMNVLNGNIIKDKVHARRYFKTLEVPQKWGITYGVLYRINGEWGITHNFVRFKDKCCFEHLDQELDYYLGEAVDEIDYKDILSPYYIASPEGRDFTMEQLYDIIDIKNPFKRLFSIHELEIERQKGCEELKTQSILPYLTQTDKSFPALLKSYGLTSFYDIRMKDRDGLLALKGISQKRFDHIQNAFAKAVLEKPDEFAHFIKFIQMKADFDRANQFMEKYCVT